MTEVLQAGRARFALPDPGMQRSSFWGRVIAVIDIVLCCATKECF
jgi:hypothetical protein